MKVSDVFRQRMVHHRRRQDLTQAQLSERLVAMGVNLSRATVAEIESAGTRGNRVTLEEAVAITAALNVPLRVMLLPLTEGDKDDIEDYDIEIGNQRANVWKLQRWLRGDAASYLLPGGAHVWFDAARPLRIHEGIEAAERSAKDADSEIEYADSESKRQRARRDLDAALEALDRLIPDLRALGVPADGWLHPDFETELKKMRRRSATAAKRKD